VRAQRMLYENYSLKNSFLMRIVENWNESIENEYMKKMNI